ncbi:type III-B CRISPR module RAMP protein Cmr4, partial [Methanothrix sp.]|uniref:type III-B CRISPR module RAMP protein Cmr4 n=1 Tax=Methanothrix sp. TaxID=90426 RepID=UPI0032AEB7D5
PLVPGSAVKGVLRDHFFQNGNDEQKKLIDIAFGKQIVDDSSNAGSLILTDAHIVCLPVRSLYGTFAYITSPLVLEKLKRDLEAAGYKDLPSTPNPARNEVLLVNGSKIVGEGRVFFEDLDFTAKEDENAKEWAEMLAGVIFPKESAKEAVWNGIFEERFAVLNNDCFNFLSKTGTEVTAHVRIEDNTKIVAIRALWYEETLPAEAILAGVAWCDRVFGGNGINQSKILETYCPKDKLDLQMGGKATVGKGRVRYQFTRS